MGCSMGTWIRVKETRSFQTLRKKTSQSWLQQMLQPVVWTSLLLRLSLTMMWHEILILILTGLAVLDEQERRELPILC